MKLTEIAWAAGFLEGDGSFMINGQRCPMISLSQVNKEPAKKLHKLFGGAFDKYNRNENPNWNSYWRWQIYGRPAIEIMMTIYSFMSKKRKAQIKKCIKVWQNSGFQGSRKDFYCGNGHKRTQENTGIDKRGYRYCKDCKIEWQRRNRTNKKN